MSGVLLAFTILLAVLIVLLVLGLLQAQHVFRKIAGDEQRKHRILNL